MDINIEYFLIPATGSTSLGTASDLQNVYKNKDLAPTLSPLLGHMFSLRHIIFSNEGCYNFDPYHPGHPNGHDQSYYSSGWATYVSVVVTAIYTFTIHCLLQYT